MSINVTERYLFVKEYEKGNKSITEKAESLKISQQQAYRIIKKYNTEGILGLQHRDKNKVSHNKHNKAKNKTILQLIKEKHYNFGPNYASELLSEEFFYHLFSPSSCFFHHTRTE